MRGQLRQEAPIIGTIGAAVGIFSDGVQVARVLPNGAPSKIAKTVYRLVEAEITSSKRPEIANTLVEPHQVLTSPAQSEHRLDDLGETDARRPEIDTKNAA